MDAPSGIAAVAARADNRRIQVEECSSDAKAKIVFKLAISSEHRSDDFLLVLKSEKRA